MDFLNLKSPGDVIKVVLLFYYVQINVNYIFPVPGIFISLKLLHTIQIRITALYKALGKRMRQRPH